jgi:hypothetical protein
VEETVQVQLKKAWQGHDKDASVKVSKETAEDLVDKGIAAWIPPTGDNK